MRTQKDYLMQFMRPGGPSSSSKASNAPPEASAGLPPEAARVLLLSPGPGPSTPWCGLPAEYACLAATLRLFTRLGCAEQVDETACDRLCSTLAGDPIRGGAEGVDRSQRESSFLELAAAWGLDARPVASAIEPLEAMVKGRPTTCCIFLDAYVGVLEDPETGEESEQEVGSRCVLIIGGDLLGPTFVAFDPWGTAGGEVSLWPDHAAQAASPLSWVVLSPKPVMPDAASATS
ncbi:unnamed protein product [Polarella glacialis]|uniref:Glutathione gamma-glutamylcysteinyltransferase n=1 Tax=Polarella glacialis TaxID=89957 RepID=A0A813GR91_POLGL|nr:unnamed protein product [Polarella glacialis]